MTGEGNPVDRLNYHVPADSADSDFLDTEFAHRRRCCCWFRPPSLASSSSDTWWSRGWRKLREWSEIVAGPRWKTFIRRFRKNKGGERKKFGYDPLSYAMNFDEEGNGKNGDDGDWDDDDLGFRDFSSRYAVIPASAKSSFDWGRDGATFS
ncbi:hypothetical protein Droror1_Dr00016937 [Drosera rotundifolia]